ncbi:hypothetical protein HXX76_015085 [Chlamydomonas incerta]|uniref:Uncharacterized protein n=1 Tax=Chlamydomonas incerta TaxID=51695 RepID=A0A835SNK2_CHLIN|nr:hypothetical protein HXX76_015085 [Chlamydomonas incerta]|eukprot:KAG2423695.1 hypothetical protein HXX76_015085 [Chlamydomonas incerta]
MAGDFDDPVVDFSALFSSGKKLVKSKPGVKQLSKNSSKQERKHAPPATRSPQGVVAAAPKKLGKDPLKAKPHEGKRKAQPASAGEPASARPGKKPRTQATSGIHSGTPPAGKAAAAPAKKQRKEPAAAPPIAVAAGTRPPGMGSGKKEQKQGKRVSSDEWPFEVDYNDHFETSAAAVDDIQPVLLALCKRLKKTPAQLAVYDPFFCQGGIRRHYTARGFTNFIHRKRDFYADVESGQLPEYDIMVTNPPYSADHKERILDFCLRSGKPWALLLPNYVATKAYYSELVDEAGTPPQQRPFYLTPVTRYAYEHPEGTGHAESPFYSIWYVGLGAHTEAVYGACRTKLDSPGPAAAASGARAGGAGGGGGGGSWAVTLARSVDALREAKAVPTAKRLNPKQRARLKKKMAGS